MSCHHRFQRLIFIIIIIIIITLFDHPCYCYNLQFTFFAILNTNNIMYCYYHWFFFFQRFVHPPKIRGHPFCASATTSFFLLFGVCLTKLQPFVQPHLSLASNMLIICVRQPSSCLAPPHL